MATTVQANEKASPERALEMIDLRSDTVTKPTPEMWEAMASAEVGDDVYGEDPTVNRLQARAAEIFGREAAIFVPTGTMGNQIAIRLHTQHGQEVICEARSHIVDWEMAMIAAFSGCQVRTLQADRGILTWELIKTALFPRIYYRAETGLIALENTHNRGGGTVTPLEVMKEIWAGAKDAGLPVHLDGARVFHAATYLGLPVAEITRGFGHGDDLPVERALRSSWFDTGWQQGSDRACANLSEGFGWRNASSWRFGCCWIDRAGGDAEAFGRRSCERSAAGGPTGGNAGSCDRFGFSSNEYCDFQPEGWRT